MTSTEPVLKPKPDAVYDTPPVEKRRCIGGGGFVFLCALAGHTEVRASAPPLKIRSITTRSRRPVLDAIPVERLRIVICSYGDR